MLKPDWALGGGLHVTNYLGFISGATPADLLVANMATKPFLSMYLQAGIGGIRNRHLSIILLLHSVRPEHQTTNFVLCEAVFKERSGFRKYEGECYIFHHFIHQTLSDVNKTTNNIHFVRYVSMTTIYLHYNDVSPWQ